MSFRAKIWAAMVAAGLVPVVLLGLLSYSTGRRELAQTIGRLQTQTAHELARYTERLVADAVTHLQLSAGYIPFDKLERQEIAPALAIPYRQLPAINALALLDGAGEALAPPVHEPHPEAHVELAGHEAVGDVELDLFAAHVPLASALKSGAAVGPPYRAPGRGPRVALAVRVPAAPQWAMAAELSLSEIEGRVDELGRSGEVAFLVDANGVLLAHSGGESASLSEAERALVAASLKAMADRVEVVARPEGAYLAAFAPVERLGWGIVVAQPASKAFGAADRVRDLTALWGALAAALALVLGGLLARGLSRPIRALSQVAHAATGGVYEPAPGVEGKDELGTFAQAFNHMIAEIKRRDAEIRGWNEQLQKRVDERTTELKQAQDQISRTRRLAALGSLGAGVAHEINNPLTSIIGLLTLLKKDAPEGGTQAQSAALALDQARRVARIVSDLRQLATAEQEQAGRRLALAGPIQAALEASAEQLKAGRITVTTDLASPSPEVLGDALQLQQVLTHLVQNALAAMPDGGELRVCLRPVEGQAVKLTVADTGKGIPAEMIERIFDPFFTTKEAPTRLGMGLSLCHAIVEAHHGKITVQSEQGCGTTFTVLLPAAPQQAHLA